MSELKEARVPLVHRADGSAYADLPLDFPGVPFSFLVIQDDGWWPMNYITVTYPFGTNGASPWFRRVTVELRGRTLMFGELPEDSVFLRVRYPKPAWGEHIRRVSDGASHTDGREEQT